MPPLSLFASDRYPLRCSKIPQFLLCPWQVVMQYLNLHERDGGSAAQTGTAMHKAVQLYHSGKEVEAAIAEMNRRRNDFPLADLIEAARLFRQYVKDERNQGAKVVHTEFQLQGAIEPGIVLQGTLDQIREEEDGSWKVYDLKSSRFSGPVIKDHHTYQQAAYAYLASQHFHREVLPGAIIMARDYDKKSPVVFYPYDLTYKDVANLMAMVAHRVREVRAGRLIASPGEHCGYCIGVPACLSKFNTYTERNP